jgi:hypothetical protein
MLSNSARHKRVGRGGAILVIIALVMAAVIFFKPEVFRTPVQVPASVTVRTSFVGLGNVVQIRSFSTHTMNGVVVTGRNSAKNQTARHWVGSIRPNEVVEVGWQEWNWTVAAGETITVSADGYLPIVFSSEQLGIR